MSAGRFGPWGPLGTELMSHIRLEAAIETQGRRSMLDNEMRRAQYLAKANEAKEIAEKFKNKESREQWERFAVAYLELAKAF
jgi:hypothetical protein